MPWSITDAQKHTRLADTPHKKRLWRDVANNALKRYGDDGKAIAAANAAVAKYEGR